MTLRTSSDIIADIKSLVYSRGYIYALCLIIFEDFHIHLVEIHKVDFRSRLNKNEVSFLIGLLLKRQINFSYPEDPFDLIEMKNRTYFLMGELHESLALPSMEKMLELLNSKKKGDGLTDGLKDVYKEGNMFVEPIFYANDGVYDFQYRDFIPKKYQYDQVWLRENRQFEFDNTISILEKTKEILLEKRKKVSFYSIKEQIPKLNALFKEENPSDNWEEEFREVLPLYELYQFKNLFFEEEFDSLPETSWKLFYDNLLELFIVRKSDFNPVLNVSHFLYNFSLDNDKVDANKYFFNVGDFNEFKAKPIIKLSEDRFFVPITFSLYEACYEAPYYWMVGDKTYRDQLAKNRGDCGEQITHELLSVVFGVKNTLKSVKIISKKGEPDTDIDILCILGSKALCIQVKSKKLTEPARKGNYENLVKDFKGAVQDAFNQGLISRNRILEKNAKFYDENGVQINLPEGIDEVYILGITTENYPALTHQTNVFLQKNGDDPWPVFMSIFDLEVVCHYLKNPYDFLYYIRQRSSLADCFNAESELVYLGFHLDKKLFKKPEEDMVYLEPNYGGVIDRNYYPLRLNVDITNKGDIIKNKWRNLDFELICYQITKTDLPKTTDVIFELYDWNEPSINNLTEQIKEAKKKSHLDGKSHNFTLISKEGTGISYFVLNNNNPKELLDKLLLFCQARKYKSRANSWVGLGSLKDSPNIIDTFVFNKENWVFDKDLDYLSKELFSEKPNPIGFAIKNKSARNQKCPCGSGKKFKKCCLN